MDCSFYKVSVENNNVKQEYERVEMLRKTSQLEKKDIKKLTYLYFGNDTLVFLIVSISFNMKNWMHISMVNMEWIYIVIGMLIGGVRKMQDIAILLREKKFLKFYIA